MNIRGTSATLANCGITMSGGIDQHGILYNLPEATTFNAHSIGFWGTLLAPNANVTFNNGNWDGGMYAVSLTGNRRGPPQRAERPRCLSVSPRSPPQTEGCSTTRQRARA